MYQSTGGIDWSCWLVGLVSNSNTREVVYPGGVISALSWVLEIISHSLSSSLKSHGKSF